MSRDCLCLMLALCCQDVSSLGRGFMSRDCLCLMLALCCQDVSALGRGVQASGLSGFNIGPMLARRVVFRQGG